jgi:hypothetical protein
MQHEKIADSKHKIHQTKLPNCTKFPSKQAQKFGERKSENVPTIKSQKNFHAKMKYNPGNVVIFESQDI